jgi:hypothetical protein
MSITESLKRIIASITPTARVHDGMEKTASIGWERSLKRAGKMLATITADSEDSFIKIGERLKEYHGRAQEMCRASNSIVELMTGEALHSAERGLSVILEDLSRNITESDDNLQQINKVFEQHVRELGKVSSNMDVFRSLTLNLTMLGFLTRVENAHISGQDLGFSSLTNDVLRLSETIRERSTHISSASQTVKTFAEQALVKISCFEKANKESARSTHEQAVQSHRSLCQKFEVASRAAKLIDQRTNEIASSIEDIVMSLQFHDITRQQNDHVKEVFGHLCDELEGGNHTILMQAALVRDIIDLQRAQLNQSQEDLAGAVSQIIQNLQAISKSVGQILHETRDIAWASDMQGISFMEDLERGISSVIECVSHSADEQAGLADTVGSASDMVSDMSTFVQDIESLGLSLQLIALNARIKAAHLGSEGAALDTISGSIYELSQNAREDTRALSSALESVTGLSSGFKEDLRTMQDTQSRNVGIMVDELKRLTSSLSDINDTVLTMLVSMTDLGESLLKDIRETAEGITVHEEVETLLNEVMAIIDTIGESARNMCPEGQVSESLPLIANIDSLYTMKSERDIHARHVQTLQQESSGQQAVPVTGDLGENVELF